MNPNDIIEFIDKQTEKYNEVLVILNDLAIKINKRLDLLENNVSAKTETIIKDFGNIKAEPSPKPVEKISKAPSPKPVEIKEVNEKKKYEKSSEFFVYDYPLNPELYKKFIPEGTPLNLSPANLLKKIAVKKNPFINEFQEFIKNRKEEYNLSF